MLADVAVFFLLCIVVYSEQAQCGESGTSYLRLSELALFVRWVQV